MHEGYLPLIRVVAQHRHRHDATLVHGGTSCRCAIGRSGLRLRKREGDGATPIGRWPLRSVLVRRDRVPALATGLPVSAIAPGDGWCDDPADRLYNRPVPLPWPGRTESLWRDDELYDVVVVLGHNDAPPVPGRGSAVFFHLATPDYAATAGCVAVARPDMLAILARCNPQTVMAIG